MKTAAARALSFHPVAAVAVSLLMAILLVNGAVLARAQTAPEWVEIEASRLTIGGSGCSPDDTVVAVSSDKRSVTIIFSKLRAIMAGTNSTEEEKDRFCTVALRVKFPPGWSYSIGKTTARGFAELDDGVRGTHHMTVRISGTGVTARTMYSVLGPYKKNYEFTRRFNVVVNSECDDDRHMHIENQVRVEGPDGAQGIITVDSVDQSFEVVYPIEWKTC